MTTYISHNIGPDTVSTLLSSGARAAVLRVFMLDPRRAYYQRQLEAATGMAIRGVQRELDRLVSVELLYRRMEGNRAYYRVDMQFPLFPELRGIILKTADAVDRLRGELAMCEGVLLAFYGEAAGGVFVVTTGGDAVDVPLPEGIEMTVVGREAFLKMLVEDRGALEAYLAQGEDLLGRRDDVIWRRIEQAGFVVKKREGVA